MRDMTDDQFRKIAETRKAQMRAWKAIPESKRPTWEQFKRGLEVKEHSVLNQNVSPTTVKLKGPNGTTKEISLDEWNSYTPLNRHAQRIAALSHTLKELDIHPLN